MYNDVCELVPVTIVKNSIGDPVRTDGTHLQQVPCRVKSVSMRERYMAETVGGTPELVITLADKGNYNGEERVVYRNVTYRVVREYFTDTSSEIELVVSKWQP